MSEAGATKIESGVWIAAKDAVTPEFLANNNVEVVISAMAEEAEPIVKNAHSVPVEDSPEANATQHFARVNAVLHYAKNANRTTVIYCSEGTDRAAALLVAHYMIENQWSRKQAMEFVTRSCPSVDIRDGLMNELGSLDASIRLGLYNVD
jgi:protein-tyrosine phosphatase